jgi:hypothetical protein
MVDDQTVNMTNKHLKKREKKFLVQEQYNVSLRYSGFIPLASSPVCMHLLGRFGAGVWWCWGPPVAGAAVLIVQQVSGLAGQRAGGWAAVWQV